MFRHGLFLFSNCYKVKGKFPFWLVESYIMKNLLSEILSSVLFLTKYLAKVTF